MDAPWSLDGPGPRAPGNLRGNPHLPVRIKPQFLLLFVMPTIVSWIREKDDPRFDPWFEDQPGLTVHNARQGEGPQDPRDLIGDAAGLLLTGGPDISAEFLDQPVPDPAVIEDPEPERDRWEFAAVRQALERGLPILAICKGHQVLNVATGGTLHLDIQGHYSPELSRENIQLLRYAADAQAVPHFDLVNSSHHQAIDRLGAGLKVEAWCAEDGIIEQVRMAGYPFCLGVQYHPERHPAYAPLFRAFFDALTTAKTVRSAAPLVL